MEMTGGVTTTGSAEKIRSVKLARSFRGYDRSSVEKLVNEAASTLETLAKERDELKERVQQLESEIGEERVSQQLVRDTLVSAQRAATELQERTEKECRQLLESAGKQAQAIEAGAKLERRQLEADLQRLKEQEQELRASYRVLLHAALDRLGEESAQKATGVHPSLIDVLSPRRVLADAPGTPAERDTVAGQTIVPDPTGSS